MIKNTKMVVAGICLALVAGLWAGNSIASAKDGTRDPRGPTLSADVQML